MSTLNLSEILFAGTEHRPFVLEPDGHNQRGTALLLHGFPGTPAEMRPLGQHLACAGWLVYGPLLPGFGAEINRLGTTYRQVWVRAAQEAGVTLRRRRQPLILAGYSMGAAVALNAAAAIRPDILVLIAPFWRAGDWRARLIAPLKYFLPEIAPFAQADFRIPELRRFLEEMVPSLDLDDPAVRHTLKTQLVLPTAIMGELLQLGREAFRSAAQINVPTLILQGRRDDVVTPSATRALVEQMGGPVSYHEVPGNHTFFGKAENRAALDLMTIIGGFLERNLS